MTGVARTARLLAAVAAVVAVVAGAAGIGRADVVAVTGGTVHPVSGPAIENGVVVMRGEVIVAVGPAGSVSVPEGAEVVDAKGLHVWPGLVDAYSYLGLTEIGSVRGTRDETESGAMNPNARAEVAINASSSHFPVTRANGTLLAATFPSGSMVPGSGAAIVLDGWTWEEMVRRAPIGLAIQWPVIDRPENPGDVTEVPKWMERVARLDEMITEARAYDRARTVGEDAREADVRWESLRPVVTGETPVWVLASSVAQIRSAMEWTEEQGLRMVLVDGSGSTTGDAWRLAEELAAREVPVVVQTTRRPRHRYDPYDAPFAAPGLLHEAGVDVVFGSWNSAHSRDLPQEAARAVTYGMPREAVEEALTVGACRVLGLDDRYGTLETGKSATLILVEGDLLDIRMNVVGAWLDGAPVDLESRHTRLWKKWSARPRPVAAEDLEGE